MKIALVSQPFDAIIPPLMNSIGIWTYEVSRRIAQQHPVIVYARRGLSRRKEIGQGVETRYIYSLPNPWLTSLSERVSARLDPKKPLYSSQFFYLEYALPIALDLRRQKVDIVHIQNYSQFVPIIRLFNPYIKIVLHMRCEWLELLDYERIDRRLHQTDLILGVSDEIINAVRQRFPHHAARCSTAYTGVDIEAFRPADSARLDGDKTRLLFVGRVTPEKGVHVLIEAFKQVAPRFPGLELDVVGAASSLARDRLVSISEDDQVHALEAYYSGADYKERLLALLPDELKGRVHFTGHVRYSKTLEYYQNAAVLINPALSEPFGRSLIEANACGVPTIATRVGGMTELVEHGKNGLLVEPGDVDGLAQAMLRLLENEQERRQMGTAGRQFVVNRFSWDRVTAKLIAHYANLLPPYQDTGEKQLQRQQAHGGH